MINKINSDKCIGCGTCIDRCNMDVLRLDSESDIAYIAYPEDCMTCFECELNCPTEAITVNFQPGYVPSSLVFTDRSDYKG